MGLNELNLLWIQIMSLCLKKTFSETDKEYIVGSVFKADVCDMYNNFELDSIGQGVA